LVDLLQVKLPHRLVHLVQEAVYVTLDSLTGHYEGIVASGRRIVHILHRLGGGPTFPHPFPRTFEKKPLAGDTSIFDCMMASDFAPGK
jgi:hypothetical protein